MDQHKLSILGESRLKTPKKTKKSKNWQVEGVNSMQMGKIGKIP